MLEVICIEFKAMSHMYADFPIWANQNVDHGAGKDLTLKNVMLAVKEDRI